MRPKKRTAATHNGAVGPEGVEGLLFPLIGQGLSTVCVHKLTMSDVQLVPKTDYVPAHTVLSGALQLQHSACQVRCLHQKRKSPVLLVVL